MKKREYVVQERKKCTIINLKDFKGAINLESV